MGCGPFGGFPAGEHLREFGRTWVRSGWGAPTAEELIVKRGTMAPPRWEGRTGVALPEDLPDGGALPDPPPGEARLPNTVFLAILEDRAKTP